MQFYRISDISFDYEYLVQRQENTKRTFIPFKNFVELFTYSSSNSHLFEVINLNRPHKIFFDIDIEMERDDKFFDNIASTLINRIIYVFKSNFDIDLDTNKDILIFESHGDNKGSFHIIIDHYYSRNLIETKFIINNILSDIQYKEFIDDKIYTKTRNMRLYLSTKYGSPRTKMLYRDNHRIKYSKYFDNDYHTMYRSLIQNTKMCKEILTIEKSDKIHEINIKPLVYDKYELNENCIKYIKSLLTHFDIRDINMNMIILNSKKGYVCELCKRRHDNENPYIIFDKISGEIRFFCRRNNNYKVYGIWIETEKIQEVKVKKVINYKLRKKKPRSLFDYGASSLRYT